MGGAKDDIEEGVKVNLSGRTWTVWGNKDLLFIWGDETTATEYCPVNIDSTAGFLRFAIELEEMKVK